MNTELETLQNQTVNEMANKILRDYIKGSKEGYGEHLAKPSKEQLN